MLTSPELVVYIAREQAEGDLPIIEEFEIEYHKRIAMSFASFILTSDRCFRFRHGKALQKAVWDFIWCRIRGLSFSYILFEQLLSALLLMETYLLLSLWI